MPSRPSREDRTVPEWLSEEWVKELASLAEARPPVPGATGTISVAITGGPGGDVLYHWSYRDGVPGAGGIGAAADADLSLIIGEADARTVASGDMEPSVAYMRGRLKASGDNALLLGLLASTGTESYREWRGRAAGLA
jgi:hypothetical protein